MNKIIFYSTIALLFCGCGLNFKTHKASLSGTWMLYDAAPGKNKADDFNEEAALTKTVSDGDQYCFSNDGTYTRINGKTNYSFGTWKINDKNDELTITPNGSAAKTISVVFNIAADKKEYFSAEAIHNGTTLKYVKAFPAMEELKNDPYYKDNNLWRIKPAQAETDAQITDRLANYLKHMALILKAAYDRKQQVVSFERSMGPIKIYNGGIGIHSFSIVPDTWKQCFFNDDDAQKAYDMYNKVLGSSSYRGASSGNWYQDDYKILLSVYNEIHTEK